MKMSNLASDIVYSLPVIFCVYENIFVFSRTTIFVIYLAAMQTCETECLSVLAWCFFNRYSESLPFLLNLEYY